MFRSLQILLLGIFMFLPMAFGQLGNLSDYDGVLQAKFALKISELEALGTDVQAQTYTLTSNSLIREYKLPETARVFWVFHCDGPHIEGGLVLADSATGEIYSVVAQATQISLDDFVEQGGGFDIGGAEDRGMEAWHTAKYELLFDIDGLQLSMQALMKFQFTQEKDFTLLRMSSIAGPVGEGAFDDQTLLAITGSSISASGIIANLE